MRDAMHGIGGDPSEVEPQIPAELVVDHSLIADVFGSRKTPVPVVAAKGHTGNLGAGSGMIELIASVLALRNDRLFATLNHETPDPECPINVVADGDVPPGDSFINLSVTPQGQASAIVVQRFAG